MELTPETVASAEPLLAREWSLLRERRYAFVQEVDRLRAFASNLGETPEALAYREAKRCLSLQISKRENEFERGPAQLARRARWTIEWRRKALTDPATAAEVAARARQRQARLAELERLSAPKVVIENECRLIYECVAPIEELEEMLSVWEREAALHRAEIDDLRGQLGQIEDMYKTLKRGLKETLRAAKGGLARSDAEMLRWAALDRARLAWFLRQAPTRREEALRVFVESHPSEDLREFLPPVPPSAERAHELKDPLRKRRKRAPLEVPNEAESPRPPSEPQRSWTLVWTNEAQSEEVVIPEDPKARPPVLKRLLTAAGHASASPRLILAAISRVTAMSVQQRQTIRKLAKLYPEGWKVISVGSYRLFLDVDESARRIRTLVRHRREAYARKKYQR